MDKTGGVGEKRIREKQEQAFELLPERHPFVHQQMAGRDQSDLFVIHPVELVLVVELLAPRIIKQIMFCA